jgi:hypothetical protein
MYTLSARNGSASKTMVGPIDGNSLGWVGELDEKNVGSSEGVAEGIDEMVGALLMEGEKDGRLDKVGSNDGSCDGNVLGNKEMVGTKDALDGGRYNVGGYVTVGRGVMVG